MAIAQDVANPAARTRIHRLIKVGFSPEQAFALESGGWSQHSLEGVGKFTRHQVTALTTGSPTVADLIEKAHFTRAQAQLVFSFYIG